MAYILLALGAAMSLVGLAAMVTGYPMIEIERGWATVITGAVLLSGGLVVVALGLVVRHLIGLRRALSVVSALPQPADTTIPQPMVVQTPLMPMQAAMPAVAPLEVTRPSLAAFDVAPGLAAGAIPAGAAALAAAVHTPTEPEAPHLPEPDPEPAPAQQTKVHVPEAYVPEVHAPEPHEAAHEPVHEEPVHQESVHAEPADPLAIAPEPPPPAEPEHPKSDEDWLDQAFSAFDYEMTNGHAPTGKPVPAATTPEPPHEPPPQPAHEPEPAHEMAAHAAEAVHEAPAHEPELFEPHHEDHPEVPAPAAEAPATAPPEPAANLNVIGRYDSEGTSYVMYADGSIEAQSEAGVYRFGSMAELKAFIEG